MNSGDPNLVVNPNKYGNDAYAIGPQSSIKTFSPIKNENVVKSECQYPFSFNLNKTSLTLCNNLIKL